MDNLTLLILVIIYLLMFLYLFFFFILKVNFCLNLKKIEILMCEYFFDMVFINF